MGSASVPVNFQLYRLEQLENFKTFYSLELGHSLQSYGLNGSQVEKGVSLDFLHSR